MWGETPNEGPFVECMETHYRRNFLQCKHKLKISKWSHQIIKPQRDISHHQLRTPVPGKTYI